MSPIGHLLPAEKTWSWSTRTLYPMKLYSQFLTSSSQYCKPNCRGYTGSPVSLVHDGQQNRSIKVQNAPMHTLTHNPPPTPKESPFSAVNSFYQAPRSSLFQPAILSSLYLSLSFSWGGYIKPCMGECTKMMLPLACSFDSNFGL